MALSRRVFLYLVGFASLFGRRASAACAVSATAPDGADTLVVVNGWVLRRDDLQHLPHP